MKVLNCICLNCSMVRFPNPADITRVNQLTASSNPRKRLNELAKLLGKVKKCTYPDAEDLDKKLRYCDRKMPKRISVNKEFKVEIIEEFEEKKRLVTALNAAKILHILERMSDEACQVLGFRENKPKDLVLRTLLVCPPQVRPSI